MNARPDHTSKLARGHRLSARTSRILLVALPLLGLPLAADDWPQLLGPQRNGHSHEVGLYRSWPAQGPEVLWRADLGDGYSGVVVAGPDAFTLFGADGQEWVIGFDATTGTERWRTPIDRNRRDNQGGGPRSTPVTSGGYLYVLGAQGQLAALDRADGTAAWQIDLRKTLRAEVPEWGIASSPLVEAGKLIVEVAGKKGAYAVAFDLATGALRWQAGTGSAGYASPIVAPLGSGRQLVFHTVERLLALDPADGTELWRIPWNDPHWINSASPVFVPNNGILVASENSFGTGLLQVVAGEDPDRRYKVVPVWQDTRMKAHWNTFLFVGRHFYGFDSKGFSCLDALTGKRVWRARGGVSAGSLIHADGHLLVLGDNGLLALVEASPEAYRLQAEAKVIDGRTWTSPALANGVLYVRSPRQLVALRVATHAPKAGR